MVGARAAIERRSGRFGIEPADRATDGDDVECPGVPSDVREPAGPRACAPSRGACAAAAVVPGR